MSYKLPPISALSSSPVHIQEVLDHLFEPSPALQTLVASKLLPQTYNSYDAFIEDVAGFLIKLLQHKEEKEEDSDSDSNNKLLVDILAAHPRLGAKKMENLSEHSASEQKSLVADNKEEEEKLGVLNDKYEGTFPGLRYVVFVNGRSRAAVMRDMEARIARGNIEEEKMSAIEAMRDIAKDRASKLH